MPRRDRAMHGYDATTEHEYGEIIETKLGPVEC